MEAARVLLRHARAKTDGVMPAESWPAADQVRRKGSAWVVDVDTSRLPGGYPEQFVVDVTTTGGHSGVPGR